MKVQLGSAMIALAVAAALPASASAQDITAIDADWSNTVGGQNIAIDNAASPISVSWGNTVASGLSRSAYTFQTSAVPILFTGNPFQLGTFTHSNFTIPNGTGISSVDLLLGFNIAGATPSVFSDSWTLNHEETSNSSLPCAYPGGPSCADRVTFNLTSGSAPTAFEYNGLNYQVTVIGFGDTAEDAALEPAFVTFEAQNNSTFLWARIDAVPTNTVPEPATMVLLATGLAGLASTRRRARKS
jgi:hypothetical protein